jgi:hypothetical protein
VLFGPNLLEACNVVMPDSSPLPAASHFTVAELLMSAYDPTCSCSCCSCSCVMYLCTLAVFQLPADLLMSVLCHDHGCLCVAILTLCASFPCRRGASVRCRGLRPRAFHARQLKHGPWAPEGRPEFHFLDSLPGPAAAGLHRARRTTRWTRRGARWSVPRPRRR